MDEGKKRVWKGTKEERKSLASPSTPSDCLHTSPLLHNPPTPTKPALASPLDPHLMPRSRSPDRRRDDHRHRERRRSASPRRDRRSRSRSPARERRRRSPSPRRRSRSRSRSRETREKHRKRGRSRSRSSSSDSDDSHSRRKRDRKKEKKRDKKRGKKDKKDKVQSSLLHCASHAYFWFQKKHGSSSSHWGKYGIITDVE